MRLGIVGLSGAGKTTVYSALTHQSVEPIQRTETLIATVQVPDPRLDTLSRFYQPQKTTAIRIEYVLPERQDTKKATKEASSVRAPVRDCHALIHVIRNFVAFDAAQPSPADDFLKIDRELILFDYLVVENRLEGLELDRKRGKKIDPTEHTLLEQCRRQLEEEAPLRKRPDLAEAPLLRGYAFLSAKPVLILFNSEEDTDGTARIPESISGNPCTAIRGKLEQELSQLPPEEAQAFLAEYGITETAKDRILQTSFNVLRRISFFTVVGDEVRAWAIRKGTTALDAAGAVHSDMKRGFIRAEVVSFADLRAAGSYPAARKQGTVRLEGKAYEVEDGDIINFRFNV